MTDATYTEAVDVAARPRRITGGEIGRKIWHTGGGLAAFAIPYLKPTTVVLMAVMVLVINIVIMPLLAKLKLFWPWERLWRSEERSKGMPTGIIIYCIAILTLAVVFMDAKWMTAVIWGVLAFGDGTATIFGRAIGGAKLPWNSRKAISGTVAFFVFGTIGATALIVATRRVDAIVALPLAACLTFLCAIVESLPLELDDNITVPTAGAIALPLLVLIPALAV